MSCGGRAAPSRGAPPPRPPGAGVGAAGPLVGGLLPISHPVASAPRLGTDSPGRTPGEGGRASHGPRLPRAPRSPHCSDSCSRLARPPRGAPAGGDRGPALAAFHQEGERLTRPLRGLRPGHGARAGRGKPLAEGAVAGPPGRGRVRYVSPADWRCGRRPLFLLRHLAQSWLREGPRRDAECRPWQARDGRGGLQRGRLGLRRPHHLDRRRSDRAAAGLGLTGPVRADYFPRTSSFAGPKGRRSPTS